MLKILPLLVMIFAMSGLAFAAAPPSSPKVRGYAMVQLKRGKQNHLLMSAQINGKDVVFIVDSGAEISAINQETAGLLNLSAPPSKEGTSRPFVVNGEKRKIVLVPNLKTGDLNLGPVLMAIVGDEPDSNLYDKQRNGAVDGVIGTDILFRNRAVLQCLFSQIYFKTDPSDSTNITGTLDKAGFHHAQMIQQDRSLFVPCQFRGQKKYLRVDTGSFISLLLGRRIQDTGIHLHDSPVHSAWIDSVKGSEVKIADPQEHQLSIAGIPICLPVGVIQDSPLTQGSDSSLIGFLGADVLGRHSAIIDFEHRVLYFHEAVDDRKK